LADPSVEFSAQVERLSRAGEVQRTKACLMFSHYDITETVLTNGEKRNEVTGGMSVDQLLLNDGNGRPKRDRRDVLRVVDRLFEDLLFLRE